MGSGGSKGRLVYSTGEGRVCPGCGHPVGGCACSRRAETLGDGNVRVRREVAGRRGKTVTVVRGIAFDAAGLKALAGDLKKACGSGGSIKDGVIEIQGDHVERVLAALAGRGIAAKRAGG